MVSRKVVGEPSDPAGSRMLVPRGLVGEPSVPPPKAEPEKVASDLSEFDNPIYRYDFLKNAKPKQLAEVCAAFMAGNWYAFGVWASLALDGKLPPATGKSDSPHGAFWTGVLGAPKKEKDDFISFLLRAGLADTGIRYRALREPPAMPGKSSLGMLLSYFDTFRDPRHASEEKRWLGSRLVWYSNYPEERMVRLAPLLGETALMHLERFLRIRRRFFKLHTDYSTDLEELDNVFIECLRALLELAADGKSKERVRSLLEGLRKELLAENNKKMKVPSILSGNPESAELIWLDSYNDGGGMAPPTKDAGVGMLPDSFSGGRGPLSKLQLLEIARKALEGDSAAHRNLFEGAPRYPKAVELNGADWVLPVDDGAGRLAGERLFYMANFLFDGNRHLPTLSSIHVPSGRTRFMLNLGDRSSSRGLMVWGGTFMLGPDGAPVLMTQLDFEGGSRPSTYKIINFDELTGQVSGMWPLALEPSKEAALLSVAKDGYILIRGRLVWKQGIDGSLKWKTALPNGGTFSIAGERAGILTENELVLMNLAEPKNALRRPISELAKEAGGGFQPDILLRPGGVYLFDNNRIIYSFDDQTKFLWKHTDKEDSWLGMPKLWGDGLSYVNFKRFSLISPDGKEAHQFPTPDRPRDYLVEGNEVFYFTESALWHWKAGMTEAKKSIAEPISHMAKPVGVSGGKLLLRFYKDHYHLAAMPVEKL